MDIAGVQRRAEVAALIESSSDAELAALHRSVGAALRARQRPAGWRWTLRRWVVRVVGTVRWRWRLVRELEALTGAVAVGPVFVARMLRSDPEVYRAAVRRSGWVCRLVHRFR